jgi:hypothetical protein
MGVELETVTSVVRLVTDARKGNTTLSCMGAALGGNQGGRHGTHGSSRRRWGRTGI